jgi:hypothetical protein
MTYANLALEPADSGSSPSSTASLAEITPVPRNEAGQVLSEGHIWIATLVTLLPLVTAIVGGGGLIASGIYFFADHNQLLTGLFVVAGLAVGAASIQVLLRFQQVLPSRYLRSVARRAFAHRAQPLVRFGDPDAEFVDIVPRSNWGRTMKEPATDIGLLRIDSARRQLLFEGDAKRYRIPFEAVTNCTVESIRMDTDQWGTDLYYLTLLEIETSGGARELPLSSRHVQFQSRRMAERQAEAEALCERILQAIAS